MSTVESERFCRLIFDPGCSSDIIIYHFRNIFLSLIAFILPAIATIKKHLEPLSVVAMPVVDTEPWLLAVILRRQVSPPDSCERLLSFRTHTRGHHLSAFFYYCPVAS